MRQKSWIAALLLPLPFAALPLIALAIGHFEGGSVTPELTVNPAPYEQQIGDGPAAVPHRLAYGSQAAPDGCAGAASSPNQS